MEILFKFLSPHDVRKPIKEWGNSLKLTKKLSCEKLFHKTKKMPHKMAKKKRKRENCIFLKPLALVLGMLLV